MPLGQPRATLWAMETAQAEMTVATGQAQAAVVLLNLGGPDSLGAVKPFLYNLFSDPDIIRLPASWLLQKPLAWTIATTREEEAQMAYAAIGGGSPILPLTQQQANGLVQCLREQHGLEVPVSIAMRYWHPFTHEAIVPLLEQGIRHLVVVPLYPQYSHTTTGSSLNALRAVIHNWSARNGNAAVKLSVIGEYHQHPAYLQALADTMHQTITAKEWSCPPEGITVLFSAHSLPAKFVRKTGDPYPEQIQATIQALMQTHFPNNRWELAYQSKVGNMMWLGPPTDGVLSFLAASGEQNVLIVPISFVSDHVETLYEIDQLYMPEGRQQGITHLHRAAALNDHPGYLAMLAELAAEPLQPASNDFRAYLQSQQACDNSEACQSAC